MNALHARCKMVRRRLLGSALFVGVGVSVGVGVVAFARLLHPRDKMESRHRRHRDGFGRPCVGHQYTCDVQVTPGIKPSGWRKVVGFSEDAEDDRQPGGWSEVMPW